MKLYTKIVKGANGHFRNIVDALPLRWENVCVCVCGGGGGGGRGGNLVPTALFSGFGGCTGKGPSIGQSHDYHWGGGGGSGRCGLLRLLSEVRLLPNELPCVVLYSFPVTNFKGCLKVFYLSLGLCDSRWELK